MTVLVAILAVIFGFVIGVCMTLSLWRKEAAQGHFTIGDKLYRTEEVKPR